MKAEERQAALCLGDATIIVRVPPRLEYSIHAGAPSTRSPHAHLCSSCLTFVGSYLGLSPYVETG
jgi:hypothetical protein